MALEVIGAGFGRTGTLSLNGALEQLSFGPCHHMVEIFAHPELLPLWQAAAQGERPDWDRIFRTYLSTTDWPATYFWRELARHYPEARVILTTRDPDAWYRSFHDTAVQLAGAMDKVADPHMRATLEMGISLVSGGVFDNRAEDADYAKSVFRAHEQSVKEAIAPERLLVFDVGEGWQPLCNFLGVDVPDDPFPRLNNTGQFTAFIEG